MVELYFFHDEVEFLFKSGSELHRFMNAALKLLTNKTKFERGAEKVKGAISIVDNSLGVNSVDACRNVASFAAKNNAVGKTAGIIGKGAKIIGKIVKK